MLRDILYMYHLSGIEKMLKNGKRDWRWEWHQKNLRKLIRGYDDGKRVD